MTACGCSGRWAGHGACFFLVGGDWHRFTGTDVALVRGCGEHLGHMRERGLGRYTS